MREPAWKVLDPLDFRALLVAVGYAAGAAMTRGEPAMANSFLALVNRLNEGNPAFRPYPVKTSGNAPEAAGENGEYVISDKDRELIEQAQRIIDARRAELKAGGPKTMAEIAEKARL